MYLFNISILNVYSFSYDEVWGLSHCTVGDLDGSKIFFGCCILWGGMIDMVCWDMSDSAQVPSDVYSYGNIINIIHTSSIHWKLSSTLDHTPGLQDTLRFIMSRIQIVRQIYKILGTYLPFHVPLMRLRKMLINGSYYSITCNMACWRYERSLIINRNNGVIKVIDVTFHSWKLISVFVSQLLNRSKLWLFCQTNTKPSIFSGVNCMWNCGNVDVDDMIGGFPWPGMT